MSTLQEFNERNTDFWLKQHELLLGRIANPVVYGVGMEFLASDTRRLPPRFQRSMEQAFAEAESITSVFRRARARIGGLTRKADALQALIEHCVKEDPKLSQRKLLFRLKAEVGKGTILRVDDREIEFVTHKRKIKTGRIAGLKDRLSRAKKINSRKPA
jgi:predicted RNase H-like nuclease (RuvC/YqgF family)